MLLLQFTATVDITQFTDQIRMTLISELINGISKVLQKLLNVLSGTIISTSFVPSVSVSSVFSCLNWNEACLPENC